MPLKWIDYDDYQLHRKWMDTYSIMYRSGTDRMDGTNDRIARTRDQYRIMFVSAGSYEHHVRSPAHVSIVYDPDRQC